MFLPAFVAILAMFAIASAHAGEEPVPPKPFPALDILTRKADLVLRCRLESIRGKQRWRVIEALKGDYRPTMFDQELPGFISPTGTTTFATPSRHAGTQPKHKERVVFLRLQRLHSDEDNRWHDLFHVDEAFPVIGDNLTYPKTILWSHTPGTVEREFTVAEFALAVRAVK